MAAPSTQPETYSHAVHNLVFGAGGLIIFALVAFVIVQIVRRRALHGGGEVFTGFTLADLDKMRTNGEVSEDEYKRIKKKMAERWKSKMS